MRKRYKSTTDAVKRRNAKVKSLVNIRNRGKSVFGSMGERPHALGILADRVHSRPIMRYGVHLPQT